MVGERERTDGARWVLSLFSFWLQENYRGKTSKGQIEQIKTCRKKQHVRIDNMKEMSDLICGKAAVGGNYNSTRDTQRLTPFVCISNKLLTEIDFQRLFSINLD